MFRFHGLLASRVNELAGIITAAHGKVLSDAAGEVRRGLEVVDLACGFPHLANGGFSKNASTGVDVYTFKQPLGVVGITSPFNFPAMVPIWFFPIAIAVDSCVILKPSENDPSSAIWLAKLWREAGLPDGVFTVLQGDKQAVDGLIEAPEIRALSFVGSTPIAHYVYEKAAHFGKRVQALGGTNNHILVLPDADLDLVADNAINSDYGSTGERCIAQSVLLVVDDGTDNTADDLVAKIRERIANLKVGDGHGEGVDMGPLVTAAHPHRDAHLDPSAHRPFPPPASAAAVYKGRPARWATSRCQPY